MEPSNNNTFKQEPVNEKIKFYLTKYEGIYRLMRASSLDIFMKPLLQVMIDEDEIFSYNKSHDEQSIIVSENAFQKYFNVPGISEHIQYSYCYSIVRFDTSGLIDKYGVLSQLIKHFEKHKISILCESTYSYNYILYEKDKEEDFIKMVEEADDIECETE